jgi:hypothetical protein
MSNFQQLPIFIGTEEGRGEEKGIYASENKSNEKYIIFFIHMETLDPVFDSIGIVLISRINHQNHEEENAFIGKRKLKNIQIQGLIVAVERKEEYSNYTIDDGSGTILVTDWNKRKEDFYLGDLVSVIGRLKKKTGFVSISAYEIIRKKFLLL